VEEELPQLLPQLLRHPLLLLLLPLLLSQRLLPTVVGLPVEHLRFLLRLPLLPPLAEERPYPQT
jgi:hypothetical protein